MRRCLLVWLQGVVWCALVASLAGTRVKADQVEMQNGDHYAGRVITLSSNYVILESEVLGTIKLPRAKVAQVKLSAEADAATPKSPIPAGQIAPPAASSSAVSATNQDNDLARIMRRLGAHTNLISQVEGKFLKDAGPEAKAKFDDLLDGLMTGKMDVTDLRAEAMKAVRQIKDIKQEEGDEAGMMLNTYQAILEKFIKETTPPAPTPGTNQPPNSIPRPADDH